HDSGALPLDQHLRAAEHVAGRHERHRHLSDLQLLPIFHGLGPTGRYGPEPCLHHGECHGRGKDMLMPRPRGGADGRLRPAIRVDMESAWPAIEALGVHGEPRIETFGSHFQYDAFIPLQQVSPRWWYPYTPR